MEERFALISVSSHTMSCLLCRRHSASFINHPASSNCLLLCPSLLQIEALSPFIIEWVKKRDLPSISPVFCLVERDQSREEFFVTLEYSDCRELSQDDEEESYLVLVSSLLYSNWEEVEGIEC
jgi:hypothetical protein